MADAGKDAKNRLSCFSLGTFSADEKQDSETDAQGKP